MAARGGHWSKSSGGGSSFVAASGAATGIAADAAGKESHVIRGEKYNTADVVNQAITEARTLDLGGARTRLGDMGHSNPSDSLVRDYATQVAVLGNIQRLTGANAPGQVGKWNFSSASNITSAFNSYLGRRTQAQRAGWKRR